MPKLKPLGRCKSCRTPIETSRHGECERCKVLRRSITANHKASGNQSGPPAPGHFDRVNQYAAIIAAGGRIFE